MKYIIAILFFFYSLCCSSQDTILEFDRPGAADLPYLVPPKTLQVEVGYGMTITDTGNLGFDNAPGVLVRYSPFKIMELRLMINYLPMNTHFSRYYSQNDIFGFGLGGKFKICRQKGWRPELAVEGLFTFSNRSFSESNPQSVGGEIYLLANHFIGNWFYFNYNVGYVYGGTQLEHSFGYSGCFGFILHRYVELFVEHFAYFHNREVPDWGVDGGICIYPTPRLQIDLSYVRLFNSFSNQNTINLGLSYNIGLHKDHYKNLYWKN